MASKLKQTLTNRYGALQLWEIIVIALFAAFILILAISVLIRAPGMSPLKIL
ncbi:hypothetical protein F2Q70_00018561 [Brassica cretica]|uniref:Uncharacterized protein n=1 Tax=Brassica cretica TaxID=69181 RepID=A0A8S9I2L2_BRACR|nr:hypothetical protein F2Q70_00018561 [Brassica cretica]KAF2596384.1 hypothetical protein F2Q68_00012072 [Brassica cretica]